ncbi:MAG TPA: response regulator [Candidatus Omnitrophota bacterium]|nr:response regulator [Candidatus Omnitrophota bacterium]
MAQEILVIEDEPAVAEMIKFGLERAGYKIILAPNGQEALFLVSRRSPDLIISDILMPVMDGYVFYKELKKNPAAARIPVFILTARGKMEDSFRVMGVEDFIVKPLDVDTLLVKIENLLKKDTLAAQPQKTKNVLVVGSAPVIVQNIVVQLNKKGCSVETTIHGSEVMTKAREFKSDIILIEAIMAPATSEEIVLAIRRSSQFNGTSILIYSYLSAKERDNKSNHLKLSKISDSSQKCLDAGADEYIGYSSDPLFARTINKYLDQ